MRWTPGQPARRTRIAATALLAALGGFGAAGARAAELARVVSSMPVVASVPVVSQSCSSDQQIVQTAPTGAGAVIGAIAGGVLGNAVGGGAGRALATGAGVIAGSVVGNSVEAANTPATAIPVQRCQNFMSYESRTVGYDVVYEYAGQRYSTRMSRDPGREFAVSVQPAEGSLPTPVEAAPVPVYAAPSYAPPQPTATYYAAPPVYAPVYQPYYYAPAPYYYGGPTIGIGLGFGYRGRWR